MAGWDRCVHAIAWAYLDGSFFGYAELRIIGAMRSSAWSVELQVFSIDDSHRLSDPSRMGNEHSSRTRAGGRLPVSPSSARQRTWRRSRKEPGAGDPQRVVSRLGRPAWVLGLVGLLGLGTSFGSGCIEESGDDGDDGGGAGDSEPDSGSYCTYDFAAEPMVDTSWAGTVQRCSEGWVAGSSKCYTAGECEAAGMICAPRTGAYLYDTRCLYPCQPQACPGTDGLNVCKVCENYAPYCDSDGECKPPMVPVVNGYGEPCSYETQPDPCSDGLQCCDSRYGYPASCFQLLGTDGQPNPYSDPYCKMHCETDGDCDLHLGAENAYCCLDVLATEYAYVGTQRGSRTCSTREFDDRCTRVPSSSSSGSSSSSSGDPCNGCGTYGSYGSCCGEPFCAGECIGSPCC